jgi:hypothetical protein
VTEDLPAIQVLSDRFNDALKRASRYGPDGLGDALILTANSRLIADGERVLRLLEAEAAKAPDDVDVRASLAVHLFRMGWMYYDAVQPFYFSDWGKGSEGSKSTYEYANNSCNFMLRGYQLVPDSEAAFILANLFRMAGFYGTSIYWLDQASKVSADFDDPETATKAKASKLDLQAQGKTTDPPLSRVSMRRFPTASTPGLIMNNQTPANQSSTSIPSTNPPVASNTIPRERRADMVWVRNGAIAIGVGILLAMLFSSMGLFNIITLLGIMVVIAGYVKGKFL